jgi:hypothetical protein
MSAEHDVITQHSEMSLEGMRVSWSGIWAGVLVALGTLLVLSTLGLAIGFSADARDVDPQKIGTGAVVWSQISLLVALFLGGVTAARMSLVWDRPTALAQGVLVWIASLLVGLFLNANGLGTVLGAAIINGAGQRLQTSTPSAVAWTTFFAIVLSLLTTLAGAALGRRRAAVRVSYEIK